MRKIVLFILLSLFAVVPVWAQDNDAAQQLSAIPTPPGAAIVTEMSLGHDQIVGQLDTWLGMIPDPQMTKQIDTAKLKEALDPLKYVQYAEMNVPKGFSSQGIISFFEEQVAGRRVIYSIDDDQSGILLIATMDGGYFAAVVEPKSGKTGAGTIKAVRLFGFPDVRLTVESVMPIISGRSVAEPGSPKTNKPIKKAAPKSKAKVSTK